MTRIRSLMIGICIVAVTTCSVFAISKTTTAGPAEKDQKWEYKYEVYHIGFGTYQKGTTITQRLNFLSDKRWELVETSGPFGGDNFCGFVFKRLKVVDQL